MLSRVAESMFWMARYIERAENVARFLTVNHGLTLGETYTKNHQWSPLVQTTGDHDFFAKHYGEPTRENVERFLIRDKTSPNSIISCLENARENGRRIRDHISSVMWEELNKFYLMVKVFSEKPRALDETCEFFRNVRLASHLLAGATDASMSHDETWHFGQLGRLLERADKTSRILDVKYYVLLPDPSSIGTPVDVIQWSALLQSADASFMYRREHGRLAPMKIANFLVLNAKFPRSIRHCVTRAEESLHAITETPVGSFRSIEEQKMGRLRAELDYITIMEIITFGLHEFIDRIQGKINDVGNAIHSTFFEPEPPSQRKVSLPPSPLFLHDHQVEQISYEA